MERPLLMPCPSQLVTACAMQAFHSLFSAQASVACLPAELNAQIITVSAEHQCGEGRGWQCRGTHPPTLCYPRPSTTTCPARVTCSHC